MQVRDEDAGEEFAFNLAPMIDIVFLLLIFFMVATTYVTDETEIDLDLPQAVTGEEPVHPPEEIVINLTEDGKIIIEGLEMDRAALIEKLQRAANVNPDTSITIRGDGQVFYKHVVGVMDACRIAGLSNLGVTTIKDV